MVFEKYGLKNQIVVLPGFDQKVSIGEKNYLRFDGIVKDINKHTDQLCLEFNTVNTFEDGSKKTGRAFNLTYGDSKGSIIFYRDAGDLYNPFTLGQISTDALIHFGLEKKLGELFEKAGFALDEDFYNVPRENAWDLGGLLAIHLTGGPGGIPEPFPERVDSKAVCLIYKDGRSFTAPDL